MLNINLLVVVYFVLFNFSFLLAQTNQNFNSHKDDSNRGLIFEKEVEYRSKDSLYTDVIQLLSLDNKAQAMQFRLLLNKSDGDSSIIIFKDILKGTDIADKSWMLDYNVIKGQIEPNGASQDEIYVLLYCLKQNGGLLPGNYSNLIKVNYKIANLPDLQNNIKSSIKISHAEASTFEGFAIDIVPTRSEFKIYTKKSNK